MHRFRELSDDFVCFAVFVVELKISHAGKRGVGNDVEALVSWIILCVTRLRRDDIWFSVLLGINGGSDTFVWPTCTLRASA